MLHVKEGVTHRFLVVDAAMTDLIRPALYQAYHGIKPVKEAPPLAELVKADVVGPVCESGDCFAEDRLLPPLAAGDLVVFETTGAYGAAMASTYNSRPLVDGQRWAVIRPRIEVEQQIAWEHLPDWV